MSDYNFAIESKNLNKTYIKKKLKHIFKKIKSFFVNFIYNAINKGPKC